MEDLRYPIGKYVPVESPSLQEIKKWILEIEQAPACLRKAVNGLTMEQLDTPYREGGWTIRQVVHHIPDSHMNSYIRFKLALTEERPKVKTYNEALWAKLPDSKLPIEPSLILLTGLHTRWTELLRSLNESDLNRTLIHPEIGEVNLSSMIGLYAWHGKHHIAHITRLRDREGW